MKNKGEITFYAEENEYENVKNGANSIKKFPIGE